MRPTSILALILLASLLAGPDLGTAAGLVSTHAGLLDHGVPDDEPRSRPIVQASEILAKIERGEPVEYKGVIVVGDLEFQGTLASGVMRAHTIDFDQSNYMEYGFYREVAEDIEDMLHIIDYNIERSFQRFGGVVNQHTNHLNSSISITNSEIRGYLFITNVAFQESVSFRNTKFSGDADFSGTQFNDRADFDSVQFNNTAGFQSAHFKDIAEFWRVQFNGPADFDSTQFSGDADFSGAQFSGLDADFREAQFNGNAYFVGAKFSGDTNFRGAKFSGGDAYFRGAKFSGGDANFREAQFSGGDAYFRWAKFSGGDADFREAQFSEDVTFVDSGFDHANLTLDDARNIRILRLSNATFENESSISLKGIDYERLYVHWDQIKDGFVYNGEAYLTLVKNFKNIEYFEDADGCYYQYRRERQAIRGWREGAKYTDIFSWVTCGYGVKPWRPLVLGLFMVVICAAYYRWTNAIRRHEKEGDHQKANIRDTFYFSMMIFTTVGYGDWYPLDKHRILVMIEGIVGWILLSLFLVTLANVMIR